MTALLYRRFEAFHIADALYDALDHLLFDMRDGLGRV